MIRTCAQVGSQRDRPTAAATSHKLPSWQDLWLPTISVAHRGVRLPVHFRLQPGWDDQWGEGEERQSRNLARVTNSRDEVEIPRWMCERRPLVNRPSRSLSVTPRRKSSYVHGRREGEADGVYLQN